MQQNSQGRVTENTINASTRKGEYGWQEESIEGLVVTIAKHTDDSIREAFRYVDDLEVYLSKVEIREINQQIEIYREKQNYNGDYYDSL